ncbi:MAG: class II aldolase/adducin family protein [Rubrivivax sp.]
MRTDLAAAYRLAALAGWDDTVYTHLSACAGEPGVYFNEFGLGFDEVCAGNLVKVDQRGRVVAEGGRPPRR